MDQKTRDQFKALIERQLSVLARAEEMGKGGQQTVELDQQAIGRLSRMDALQNQAMAKAGSARRGAEEKRLRSALKKIETGEFGYCEDCGDEIAIGRLELNPAAVLCISCAKG